MESFKYLQWAITTETEYDCHLSQPLSEASPGKKKDKT